METKSLTKIISQDPELNSIAQELLMKYKENLNTLGANATGKLRDTAEYKIETSGDNLALYFNLLDYWYYLENGPKPHFPPISAIEKWIKVKGITPVPRGKHKTMSVKQLAFAICKSMSKGKQDTDGLLKAYVSRPAIRYLLQDNQQLTDKFIARIGELFKEQTDNEIQLVFSTLADLY